MKRSPDEGEDVTHLFDDKDIGNKSGIMDSENSCKHLCAEHLSSFSVEQRHIVGETRSLCSI